jgi:hypothetical protein
MAWSRLQSAIAPTHFGTGMESNPVTLGSACTSGSVLLAYVVGHEGSAQSGSCVSVKDGSGNSFSKLAEVTSPADGTSAKVFASVWVLATPAGDVGTTPTFTATPNALGTFAGGILVQEISGITVNTDGTIASASGTTSPTGTPAYSTAAANEYLLNYYADTGDADTWTAPAGWTLDPNNSNSSNAGQAVAYKNSTGGSETGSWSYAPAGSSWVQFIVAFQLPAPPPAAKAPADGPGEGNRRLMKKLWLVV